MKDLRNTARGGRINRKAALSFYGVLLIALVLLDQITKYLAAYFLKGASDIVLWDGVFRLHYLENSSAAFGMDPISLLQNVLEFPFFQEHPDTFLLCRMAFFILLTAVVLLVLLVLFLKIPCTRRFTPLHLTVVFFAAGAIGNLIDRIANQYVIDFFYFELIDFPVFNVADIYVTVSAVVLVILCLFYYKDADYERIFPGKPSGETVAGHSGRRPRRTVRFRRNSSAKRRLERNLRRNSRSNRRYRRYRDF